MDRSQLNGVFDESALSRLTWPIAWSGIVPQSERDEVEAGLAKFVDEAREAIRESIDGYAVEVSNGEIVGVMISDE